MADNFLQGRSLCLVWNQPAASKPQKLYLKSSHYLSHVRQNARPRHVMTPKHVKRKQEGGWPAAFQGFQQQATRLLRGRVLLGLLMDTCQLCYEWILLAVCSDSTVAAKQTLPCSGTDNIWRQGGWGWGGCFALRDRGCCMWLSSLQTEGGGALDSAGVSSCISTGAKRNMSLWIFSGVFLLQICRGCGSSSYWSLWCVHTGH